MAVANALARHAGHGLRSLHKEFGTCPSAVHGACRSAVSACAETTSLCPDFPLDPHTSNFIRSQDARHNRLTSCLQGHPKTALMGCPCKRQPSHASQPPLRCGCLRYVLRALPLINRGGRLDCSAVRRAEERLVTIKQAQDDYQRLMNNKSPKNKRR